jgi:hypothetical protein
MKTYNNTGVAQYNSSQNYGVRIISNTVTINTATTIAENVRFTFASGAAMAFEMTWYEFNLFSNSTQWAWWGDNGIYFDGTSTLSNRFGQTSRYQMGTNNGTGLTSISGTSFIWSSRTLDVSQNISSVYLVCHCSRWDKVTITYS